VIEFMPWQAYGVYLLRCGGDGGCGALLVEGDTEVHQRWHERIEKPPPPPPLPITRVVGTW
jgi:hypothetical protein